jgi:hypothetical protein
MGSVYFIIFCGIVSGVAIGVLFYIIIKFIINLIGKY